MTTYETESLITPKKITSAVTAAFPTALEDTSGEPDLLGKLRVDPGSRVDLGSIDPGYSEGCRTYEAALPKTQAYMEKIDRLQYVMHAERKNSLLIVLQGIDAGGKDGVVRHVVTSINPA